METGNYLGIYLRKGAATVVCVGAGGKGKEVLGAFGVSVDPSVEDSIGSLSAAIAGGCKERGLDFAEVFVALDCGMFMQHDVHSAFHDRKQVASTVRYDTEESLATDVTNLAIAFKVSSSDESGSELMVFTAERELLSEIISGLQANGLDPVTIEPDISCLSRFIRQKFPVSGESKSGSFYAILSVSRGYFVVLSHSGQELRMRTFLVSESQVREELLRREVPISLALIKGEHTVTELKVFDVSGSVNSGRVGVIGGLKAGDIDAGVLSEACSGEQGDNCGQADLAIAYGAAVREGGKAERINFRSDFMPYLARQKQMQKAVKFLSICAAITVISAGVSFQVKLFRMNKPVRELFSRMQSDYTNVMPGRKLAKGEDPVKSLQTEERRIKDLKSGVLSATGEKSVPAKLTMVFEAFNRVAKETNLKVDKISISNKNITITGDTSSRSNTLKFFESITKSKMEMVQKSVETKAGRDVFTMTATPIK